MPSRRAARGSFPIRRSRAAAAASSPTSASSTRRSTSAGGARSRRSAATCRGATRTLPSRAKRRIPAMPEAEILRSAQVDKAAPTVTAKWQRYLADLQGAASETLPLETQGRLVRVTGLVLEAAGIRVPVGSVCEIHQDAIAGGDGAPVIAEVVGFSGDRAYLMPTGDVHGLASGALVVPRPSPLTPIKLGVARHPWRRTVDRTLHLPVGDGLLGRVVDS